MAEAKEELAKPDAPGVGMRLAIAGIAVQFPSVKCISTEKFAEMFGGPSKQSDVIILVG
ncbi:hypothetical protein DPMN_176075 [Dreissena polymorpha]|uniref:Uncharacterized protein n=1 Tax=Dreissena polymorpha TaxID=45954 RepID=A0A9D4E8F3_DREPO|nr:hypothetical protein DPMN_176075 [Dreissena polymorpha]